MAYRSGMEFFDDARQAANLFLGNHPYGCADRLLPGAEEFRGSYRSPSARVEIPTRLGMLVTVRLDPRTGEILGVEYAKRSALHRLAFPVVPLWASVLVFVALVVLATLRFVLGLW